MEPPEEEQFDSLSSSRVSECVEEFVGDVPFAGLFKGSSLNLANANEPQQDLSKCQAIEEPPSGLRSPSLVKSVKPMPAKRSVVIKSPPPPPTPPNAAESKTIECELSPNKMKSCNDDSNEFDFDASKVWEEINTIFESIGNEVSAVNDTPTKLEDINDESNYLTNTLRKKTLTIRKPADLLLIERESLNPNWCHSANTLIYGYVLYDVFVSIYY